jgi:hypothetical protein
MPVFSFVLLGSTPDPIEVGSFDADTDGQAIDLTAQRAQSTPEVMGYEVWRRGERVAACYVTPLTQRQSH